MKLHFLLDASTSPPTGQPSWLFDAFCLPSHVMPCIGRLEYVLQQPAKLTGTLLTSYLLLSDSGSNNLDQVQGNLYKKNGEIALINLYICT